MLTISLPDINIVAMSLYNIRMITQCFFRQHCTMDLNGYTKDLTLASPDLSKMII